MRSSIAIAISLVAASTSANAEEGCDVYPPEVTLGYSDCVLRDAVEKPLWRSALERGVLQEIRFTYTEGHLAYTNIIHVTQHVDGRAILRFRSFRRQRDGRRTLIADRIRRLSANEVGMVDRLGTASGTWEHRIGSWDGDELYMHCETLDMERATSAGYRYSSVNIGCNKPEKLMPFVNFVTQLAGLTS
jgi:hypothetical protein